MVARERILVVCAAMLFTLPAYADDQAGVQPNIPESLSEANSAESASDWIADDSGGNESSIEFEQICSGGGKCLGGPDCRSCGDCCNDFYRHRSFVFGDYLFLKAYGPDFVHATQQNAAPAGQGTVPFGTAQNLIQPWRSSFRAGGGFALNNCSTISVGFMQFFSNTTETVGLPSGTTFGSVVSSVLVPGTVNSGTTFSQVTANSAINFRTADVMYNSLVFGTPNAYLNWGAGVRYGHLRQNFQQDA
jgi:hypothetical protein